MTMGVQHEARERARLEARGAHVSPRMYARAAAPLLLLSSFSNWDPKFQLVSLFNHFSRVGTRKQAVAVIEIFLE